MNEAAEVLEETTVDFFNVDAEALKERGDALRPLIAAALERSLVGTSIDDLFDQVAEHKVLMIEMRIGGEFQAVGILEALTRPDGDVLNVVVVSGVNMHLWLNPWVECLERMAKQLECKFIACRGRPGWERVLHDWKTNQIELIKRVA